MSLKDLPAAQRPRERMRSHGAAALSDAELLALLLRTGYKGTGVLALAESVLAQFGDFGSLLHASADELKLVKGLGPAKRAEVQAVLELARRALAQTLQAQPVFDAPQKVKDYCSLKLAGLPYEVFAVLFLDAQNRLLRMEEMFRGTLSQTSVYPREVARRALQLNAGAVIVSHNHPSGVAEPSRTDELMTQNLKAALRLIDVQLLDHLVVARSGIVSFAERGLL